MIRTISEKLHAKRAVTEEHIRKLEREGSAGERYTCHMPDAGFMILGLICDIGWLIQIVAGFGYLVSDGNTMGKAAIVVSIVFILIGITYTIQFGSIHEKEIALGYQKDMSFGLTVLAGIIGIIAGAAVSSSGFLLGGILNTAGGLPIYLSFRKGIVYGIR